MKFASFIFGMIWELITFLVLFNTCLSSNYYGQAFEHGVQGQPMNQKVSCNVKSVCVHDGRGIRADLGSSTYTLTVVSLVSRWFYTYNIIPLKHVRLHTSHPKVSLGKNEIFNNIMG